MAQHGRKGALIQALTANRLADGEVVYMDASGAWVEDFACAQIAEGAEAAEALLAGAQKDVAAQRIVEPYLFEVVDQQPASVREEIRRKGPSVRTDLGKQADTKEMGSAHHRASG